MISIRGEQLYQPQSKELLLDPALLKFVMLSLGGGVKSRVQMQLIEHAPPKCAGQELRAVWLHLKVRPILDISFHRRQRIKCHPGKKLGAHVKLRRGIIREQSS
jgi:hypothetical protein